MHRIQARVFESKGEEEILHIETNIPQHHCNIEDCGHARMSLMVALAVTGGQARAAFVDVSCLERGIRTRSSVRKKLRLPVYTVYWLR